MSQNPYANFGGDPTGRDASSSSSDAPPNGPPVASKLAIASLICSMIFCLPLGLLGALLGAIAFFVIGGSNGRLKGRGMAMAGVGIGLAATGGWIGVLYMAGHGAAQQQRVQASTFDAFFKLQSGDVSGVRALLEPTRSANITDAEILAFRDAWVATSGEFLGEARDVSAIFLPNQLLEDSVLRRRLSIASAKDPLPVAASFRRQPSGILLTSDTLGLWDVFLSNSGVAGTIVDIAVASPGRPAVLLSDYIGKPPADPATAPDADKKPLPGGNGG